MCVVLPPIFLERMQTLLGTEFPAFLGAMQESRINSLRVNTQKLEPVGAQNLLEGALGVVFQGVPWCGSGFYLPYTAKAGSHPLHAVGAYYIQEASAMAAAELLLGDWGGEWLGENPQVLDLCAAPGGKASHIAELTENQAELWVNDNSRVRLFKLRSNFSRLGVRYNEQTMYGIDRLPHVLPLASFDKILLDAPCSGEGLLNITRDKDSEYWSLAQIKRLQQLQKKGITAAWKLLKPGGTLVYSTCTMAPEENEAVVDYLLSRNDDAQLRALNLQQPPNQYPAVQSWNGKPYKSDLSNCLRLAPSALVEAFFVAKITKLPATD